MRTFSIILKSLSEEEIEEIKEAFNLFDTEGIGKIKPKELKAAFQQIGLEYKNPIINSIINELDNLGNETGFSFEQFLQAICSKLGNRETEEGIKRIFEMIDEDKKGYITDKDLKKVSKDIGENIQQEEIQEMMSKISSDGKNISYDDFKYVMNKKLNLK